MEGFDMRTTLILPDDLVKQALRVTHLKTKTGVIVYALKNLLQRENIQGLKNYKGKLRLNISLDTLRAR